MTKDEDLIYNYDEDIDLHTVIDPKTNIMAGGHTKEEALENLKNITKLQKLKRQAIN